MRNALLQAWQKVLRQRGDQRAVVQASDGKTATFQELEEGAENWRRQHAADATRCRGCAVVFALPNGIAWLKVFLGLLKAGAVVVPLDAAEPANAQLQQAQALRAGFCWNGETLVPLPRPKRYRDPALCLIKLTSGTTGQPRPLLFTAAQLLADARQVTATMRITVQDVNYALIPFGHSYGLGNLSLPLIAQGIPVICGSSALPHAIAADFARWQPGVFPGVPAMWRALTASSATLPGLRLGLSAGAPLPPEVARDFAARFGQRLHNFYGSSETGGITYDRRGDVTLIGGVGRALRGVTLAALRGGSLRVSSAAVLTYRNPRRNQKHGAWVMPDVAGINAHGEVTLLGRRGRTVKIAGRRVNLAEVTARLRQLTGVTDAWAGTKNGHETVLGAVVASTLTAAQLREQLHPDTAAWKIPKKWIMVSSLPLTARGKTDTRALQALLA